MRMNKRVALLLVVFSFLFFVKKNGVWVSVGWWLATLFLYFFFSRFLFSDGVKVTTI